MLANDRPGRSVHETIDLCRGLFACLVVVAHALEVTYGVHPGTVERLSPLVRDLLAVPGSGLYWVMGFFVLSGYCIHLSVARLQESGEFPIKMYLAARLTRIFPLYYAALAFTVVVERLAAGARPICWPNGLRPSVLVSQVLAVQNLTQTYGSFAPSWSITNEVFYYLSYGLLACALSRRRGWLPLTALSICLAVAVVMQALYAWVARSPFVYSAGMLFGLGINWCLGAVVAQADASLIRSPWCRILARGWAPLLALGIYWRVNVNLPPQGIYLICGLAFTLLVVRILQTCEPSGQRSESRLAVLFGLASYPMYLFHGPFLLLIGSAILRSRLATDWRLTWAILTLSGILLGLALGYLAERPLMSWRSAYLKHLAAPSRSIETKTEHSELRLRWLDRRLTGYPRPWRL